jgi:alkylation response protein AidB-like acyl-CoA dehydrogenase
MAPSKPGLASSPLVERARLLAPLLEAATGDIERDRRLPSHVVEALVSAGLFRMIVPRSLGGSEATLAECCEALEEVAKTDASTAWCLGQNNGVTWVSAYLQPESAREIFTSETRLAWGQGPSTVTRVAGGYRVTGEWRFASGIRHATWLGAHYSPLVQADGKPELDNEGGACRCTLLFPAQQAEIIDVWQVSGLRGTASDTYRVKDLFVPAKYAVQPVTREPGTMYVLGTTNIFQAGFASVALGIARGMLDCLIDLSITKTPRGMSGVLREQTTFQSQVGQSEAALSSARAFLRQTIDEVWEDAEASRQFSLKQRVRLRLAATNAIKQAAQVVDTAYYLAGGSAIFIENGFERRFRDMHAVTQQVQGRYDHFESVGKFMLGLEPDTQFL